jgi:NADPH2:quinone reductase
VTDDKLELIESAGADEVIDARGEELSRQVLAKTVGRGVDAAIDLVATASTLEVCLRSLAPAGRLVILGNRPQAVFGADPTFRVDPGLMLRKMLEIHGSRYVSMAELMQALELLRQKKIRALVTRTFPLEEAEATHQLLRENKIPGRAALLP